jgi:hypothetical protein
MTTPYMGLVLPTVGVTAGPLWANEQNAAYSAIDSHNHTAGQGVPIPSAGIAINSDLAYNTNNATLLRSCRFVNGSVLAGVADLTCVYASGGNLYYNNASGQQVQITSGAGLNAASIGAIGGDYGTSTASVFYTSVTSTFTFWQNTDTPAIMDIGDIVLHPTADDTFGTTIKANPALATNYNLTLPATLPAGTRFVTIDNSGNMAFSYDVDNSTIEVAANLIQVKDAGITRPKLAPVGQQSADQSPGTFSMSTLADVPGLSITITTTGRPVVIALQPLAAPSGAPSVAITANFIGAVGAKGLVSAEARLHVYRDASDLTYQAYAFTLYQEQVASQRLSMSFPPGIAYIDTPAAGTYTYKIRGELILGFSSFINYTRLVVYELA